MSNAFDVTGHCTPADKGWVIYISYILGDFGVASIKSLFSFLLSPVTWYSGSADQLLRTEYFLLFAAAAATESPAVRPETSVGSLPYHAALSRYKILSCSHSKLRIAIHKSTSDTYDGEPLTACSPPSNER